MPGRRRRSSASRPRQGHRAAARAAGCRPRDGGRGEGRRDHLHSLSDGDRAVRDDIRRRRRGHRSRRAHRFRLSLHHFDRRRNSLASPRYVREYGAPSFKIFMNNRGGEGARLGLPDIDDGFLFRLCEAAARKRRHGLSASGNDRDRLGAARPAEGERSRKAAAASKTWNATPAALRRGRCRAARGLCRAYRRRARSTSSIPRPPKRWRRRCVIARAGATVHIETCPHYLTHDVGWAGGDIGKINPPLREASDRERLWRGIARRGDRHRRDRSCSSRYFRQSRRHLDGVAGLSRPGNAAPGSAQRGTSQTRASARADRRPRSD